MAKPRWIVLTVLVAACSSPPAPEGPTRPQLVARQPVSSDLLEMDAENDTLNLINRTTDAVFYFVAEWAGQTLGPKPMPCTDPDSCTNVARRDTRRIAFANIPGVNQATTEIAVIHWRLVSAAPDPGFKPDSVRTTIVPLIR
jgi:hypothetical protein